MTRIIFSIPLLCSLLAIPWLAPPAVEQPGNEEEFSDAQIEFFENKVRPLLVEHCYDCHGADADPPEGGLSMVSRKAILAGGDSGSAIDLENLEKSHLLTAVQHGDLFQMPPDSKLSVEDVAIFEKWIKQKAPWPSQSDTDVKAKEVFDLAQRRAEHWSWQPVATPPVPSVENSSWSLDPIDQFILAKLETAGLEPARPTDRRSWLRRVTFDVTGLPPSQREIQDFLNDSSTDAFEKVVDRLLASPRFGERWARHWMDLIRFAETCGHEFDYPIPNAFQYRDYLIRAFNADVPYDDFVAEHIAGDLLVNPRRNPETKINESILGTGFWFLGEATHGPVDVKGDEAGRIDNQIDVFGKTFLGMTIACARCHDHKFDAISAADYYGTAGFLQSSRRQNVMLDPHQNIQDAFVKADEVVDQTDRLLNEFIVALKPNDESFSGVENYLHAAVQYLQLEQSWRQPKRLVVEGETLKQIEKTGGVAEKQNLEGWSGNGQLWWSQGKVGDHLDLEFDVPVAGRYNLLGRFTQAADYGTIKLSLNGAVIDEKLDLFSPQIKRTEEISLGTFELEAGPQNLRLEITGKNEKALDKFMFGVDYLTLIAEKKPESATEAAAFLKQIRETQQLEAALLNRWIQALQDPATQSVTHPFYLLRKSAESGVNLNAAAGDEFYRQLYADLAGRTQANQNWFHDQSREISQVVEQPLSTWDRQGWGFTKQPAWRFNPVSNHAIGAETNAPHSGLRGEKFQGVLRSPTFEIESPFIYYHANAKSAQIRLIIDGFRLDVNNGLLFSNMNLRVDTGGQWKWIAQGGDLKNYIGHRAFIEIIDQGDGFIGVDEVRFAQAPKPQPSPSWLSTSAGHVIPSTEQWKIARTEQGRSPLGIVTHSLGQAMRDMPAYTADNATVEDEVLFNFLVQHQLIPKTTFQQLDNTIAESKSQIQQINQRTPAPMMAVGMVDGSPENEFVFIRGNHKNLGDLVPRSPITALNDNQTWDQNLSASGRLELVGNLISEANPLTRRVIVNRVWHHLTGRGLVSTVDNFGVLGTAPTHPELLDYLASEFSQQGWSLKKLIKRIALSQTYRMSSSDDGRATDIDPENKWLHRFRLRRLQGEAIRDSMLAISGELDTTMYGPSVPIHLTSFMQGRGRPGGNGPLDGAGRRSIYTEVRRNFLSPMMLAFDTPIPFNSIGKRNQSNVPAQALILMNDPLVISQAEKWATRILASNNEQQERIENAFEEATGRLPSRQETQDLTEFLSTQADSYGVESDDPKVWKDLCHVLFNLKEFIYIQ